MATCTDLMAPHHPNWKFLVNGRVVQQWDSNGMPMYDVAKNGHERYQWSGGGFAKKENPIHAQRRALFIARREAESNGYSEQEIDEMEWDGTL